MILFRAILLFLILIVQVRANTIYDLIKIPNLEIYEINTKNKLKYLYAERPFRLGVLKNINCFNSIKQDYDEKYQIINKNLNKYSYNFLKKINLKYIVLCENLSISGINTAGIPNNILKTLILDIKFDKRYFERVVHHEVFHIIFDSYRDIFNTEEWKKFNDENFRYAECSTCSDKLSLDTYKSTKGFFTEYAMTTASEDMAEVFSHLIFKIDTVNHDPILEKKKKIYKKKYIKN